MNTETFSSGLHKLIKKCNSFLMKDSSKRECLGFFVEGVQIGIVRPDILEKLKQFPKMFKIVHPEQSGTSLSGVFLADNLKNAQERTSSLEKVLETLRQQGELSALQSWRNEKYNVFKTFSSKPVFQVERSATPLFGLITYGTHINGYTFDKDGKMLMWLGKRSKTKPTYPDMYDNMCAGGLAAGLGVLECAWKECQEEASVPDSLLSNLQSAGTVSCCYENAQGVFPECEFIFDLEVPPDFKPISSDGEMASFHLLTIEKVKELIVGDNFKPNCALIVLDFLLRHGILTADTEPDYCYFVEQIHTPLQTMFSQEVSTWTCLTT